MPALVELRDAGVDLGGHTVLDRLDLELSAGHVLGVTGPNGSGKTTLLRAMATLIRLDRGTGEVLGADLGSNAAYDVRPRIGLIGHTPALLQRLSLRENLVHAGRLAGIEPDRVEIALRAVGLDGVADRLVSASSFGMKRRLEVARMLMTRPRLVLLDEALTGLDPAATGLIDALLGRTIDDGGAVVVVSHDRGHLREMCDRVVNLARGRLEPLT